MAVEDFESYGPDDVGPDYIFDTWLDGAGDEHGIGGNGTGSSVYLALGPEPLPLQGEKMMMYMYDSTGSEREMGYSQAKRTFDPNENWQDNCEVMLQLWFYGDEDNIVESMWVALSDDSNEAMSEYGIYSPDKPEDITVEEWRSWNIDLLGEFGSLNLSNIETMSIGFGDRGRPGDQGVDRWGTVYFDYISVCEPICVPRYAPAGDINDDCVVDWKDLAMVASNWLIDRR
jgi:hypothetical protein